MHVHQSARKPMQTFRMLVKNMRRAASVSLPEAVPETSSWTETLDAMVFRFERALERRKWLVLGAFLGAYFLSTAYRAARKLFWFDEMFTVHLSRLPSVGGLWTELMRGSDFNPPLFYLLTKTGEALAGPGHLGMRLPEIIGLGIFCLCLFRFVGLRSSMLGGLVAMLFPLVTTAYEYAYEARPHAVVLGFCGLSMVCWQQAAAPGTRGRTWCITGLGAALTAALLNHAYAVLLFVPLAIGELVRALDRRRIDWAVAGALLTAAVAGLAVIGPMAAAAAKSGVAGASASHFMPLLDLPARVLASYKWHLEPAVVVLAGASLLFGWFDFRGPIRQGEGRLAVRGMPRHELAVLYGFVAVPVVAACVSLVTKSVLYDRYSLSVVAGFAGLLGLAAGKRPAATVILLTVMLLQIVTDGVGYVRSTTWSSPLAGFKFNIHRPEYEKRYELLKRFSDERLPIVMLDGFEFASMAYYAPRNLAERLTYLLNSSRDINAVGYGKLTACCGAPGNVENAKEFLARHDRFLVYTTPRTAGFLKSLLPANSSIELLDSSADRFFAYVKRGSM